MVELSDDHIQSITPKKHDAFLKLPEDITGYVLQQSISAAVTVDKNTWVFVNGALIRIPIFRYILPDLDPDKVALAAMQMFEHLYRMAEAAPVSSEVDQIIVLRKTVPQDKFLYQGVLLRLPVSANANG